MIPSTLAYGEEIVSTLSRQLSAEFGSGYSRPNLFRMIKFSEFFADGAIVSTLSRQLSWSHFIEILRLKDSLRRDFYAEMCRIERWNVRTLREKIDGMLFERTALSRKPEELVRQELARLRQEDTLTPDLVFRDPYLLDFLGLKDVYDEEDLEMAILREMEQFILELGVGFTFVARQKRMVIDGEDFFLDLLFYHRKLRRLIAVDLLCGRSHNRSYVAKAVMWRPLRATARFVERTTGRTPHKRSGHRRPQEVHQARVLLPPLPSRLTINLAVRQRLGLHLQIDFRVHVRRRQRHMPQPRPNRVDVHPRSKQVGRRRVPDRVRADPFGAQRRQLAPPPGSRSVPPAYGCQTG